MLVSLQAAEEALASLESATGGRRTGITGEAVKALGRARAELEFGSLEETMAHLPERMSRLQRTCSAVNDTVSDHYFDGAGASVWRAGVR